MNGTTVARFRGVIIKFIKIHVGKFESMKQDKMLTGKVVIPGMGKMPPNDTFYLLFQWLWKWPIYEESRIRPTTQWQMI